MEWFPWFLLLTSQSVSLFVTHRKKKSKHATLEFCLGLKLGLSHSEENIGSWVLKRREPRKIFLCKTNQQKQTENCTRRTFIIRTPCHILFRIKKDEIGGAHGMHRPKRTAYQLLLEKPSWKRPLGRPMHRSEDNIKIGLKEIGWAVVNMWVPCTVGNFLPSFSRS